jgi:predicted enzyme related to lactoylglutathione lyase
MTKIDHHEPGSFSWAELATTDAGAAKTFYTGLFGWSYVDSPAGPDMIYTRVQKGGKDAAALYQLGKEQKGVPPHWNVYFSVASADESASKAKKLGAKALMEPFDVMEYGRMALLQDPQSATFSLWEPRKHIGAEVMNEPNTACWAELDTTDTESAGKFYTALFGWGTKVGGDYTEFQVAGRSIGGMMKIAKEWGDVPPNWLVYFSVDDCDAIAGKAQKLGAKTFMPPTDIEKVGRFAVLQDPQGAVFAIIKLTM